MNKLVTLGLEEKLKNCDFFLGNKTVELNQNKNSKQPDQPGVVWKLCFTLDINEKHI